MGNKNNDFFLGSKSSNKEKEEQMPKIQPEANTQEQMLKTRKKGMTLKTIPMSLKKIRKVIDEINERGTPITPTERFDLSITGSYLSYLATTVQDMIAEYSP